MINILFLIVSNLSLGYQDSTFYSKMNKLLKVELSGDFPICRNCKLIVFDTLTKRENSNYKVVEFMVSFNSKSKLKKKVFINLGETFNNESYDYLMSFTQKGDTLLFSEIFIEQKSDSSIFKLTDIKKIIK